MSTMRAAVVQMRSGIDMERNITAMEELVREAAGQGADYVQTPEMTGLVQKSRRPFFDALPDDPAEDPVIEAASRLAQELSIFLHVGSTPVRVGEQKAANRAHVFNPHGDLVATYDKIHMFDVDLDNGESWRESAVYQPGRQAVMADIGGLLFGLGICYDCRFPELTTTYGRAGAHVLTAPACFTRQTGQAHWHTLLRSRAIENGAYMIAAAQGGDMEDGRETYGHSLIIDPWGSIVGEVAGEEPGIAIAEIESDAVARARAKIPNLVNNRAFDLVLAADERKASA